MKVLHTSHTKKTGIGYVRIHSKDWRHVALHDSIDNPSIVGPIYSRKKDLFSDHVPYLLRAGWLKLKVVIPEPQFISCAVLTGIAYCFEMDDGITGLRVLGNTKKEATERYVEAIAEEYGVAVTLVAAPLSQLDDSASQSMQT